MKKLLHRKMQFAIILLLTMVASAIATACVSFTLETRRYVEEYYAIENNPSCFMVLGRDDGKELIMNDATCVELIEKIETGKAKHSTQTLYHNEEAMPNGINNFYAVDDIEKIGYQVSIAIGEEVKAPQNDEIWISHVYADAYDIEVGDELFVGTVKFKVGAIINTALNSSGFIDDYAFYVSQDALEQIEGIDGYAYYIYAKNSDITSKELTDALPKEVFESSLYYIFTSTLKLCLNILSGIFGGVGVAAALIISGVSIIVLRYLVRATISKEYQIIGTYKALGMENAEIRKIYLIAYMISGCLGIIPGVFLASPIAVFLSRAVLGGTKQFHLSYLTTIASLVIIFAMVIVLYINILSELKKVQKISPIQAMNINMLSSSEKVSSSLIKNAHSSFAMAINQLWKRKGMTVLTIVILLTSVYMNLVAASVAITLSHYKYDRDIWENLPAYDCIVKMYDNEDALEYVKKSDMVEDFVAANLDPNCTGMQVEGTNLPYYELNPMIYENFTEKRYQNVPFKKGRICMNSHEITVSNSFLKEVGKKVGDYIEISNDDKKIKFLIVGSYSAMMKGGISFYMQAEDVKELGYEVSYTTILTFLKDEVSYKEFSYELENKVSGASVYKDFAFIEQEGKTVSDIADPICGVLFGAFSLFSILNIVNLIYTQNRENRRKYGILKAVGFTSAYIQREVIISFTIEYLIAVIFTIILQELLSPILFSLACGVNFIFKPAWLSVSVCGGMYIILLLIIFILSITVRKVKPVELMEE